MRLSLQGWVEYVATNRQDAEVSIKSAHDELGAEAVRQALSEVEQLKEELANVSSQLEVANSRVGSDELSSSLSRENVARDRDQAQEMAAQVRASAAQAESLAFEARSAGLLTEQIAATTQLVARRERAARAMLTSMMAAQLEIVVIAAFQAWHKVVGGSSHDVKPSMHTETLSVDASCNVGANEGVEKEGAQEKPLDPIAITPLITHDALTSTPVQPATTVQTTVESSILDSGPQSIVVKILGAKGLRNADPAGFGVSDPYCVCEVVGRPDTKFQTKVVDNCLDPRWDHLALISLFAKGDSLEFAVYDKDKWPKSDDLLGKVKFPGACLPRDGFRGELALVDPCAKSGCPEPRLELEILFGDAEGGAQSPVSAQLPPVPTVAAESAVVTPRPPVPPANALSVASTPRSADNGWWEDRQYESEDL